MRGRKEAGFCEREKAGKGMGIVLESDGGRRRGRAGQRRRGTDRLNCPVLLQGSASRRFIINCQTAVLISSAPQWKIDLISRHIFRAISLIMTGVCKLDDSAFRPE